MWVALLGLDIQQTLHLGPDAPNHARPFGKQIHPGHQHRTVGWLAPLPTTFSTSPLLKTSQLPTESCWEPATVLFIGLEIYFSDF